MDVLEIRSIAVVGDGVVMVGMKLNNVYGSAVSTVQGLPLFSLVAQSAKSAEVAVRAVQAVIRQQSPALTPNAEVKRQLEASVAKRGNGDGS